MRKNLIMLGALVLIIGIAVLASGLVQKSLVFIFWGAFLIAAIVFERVRYKRLLGKSPGPGWQPTTERFIDDESGAMVTVYIQPETGERAYVKD